MSDIEHDEIGRTFCKKHHREVCHECCMSFDTPNRMVEEEVGLIKKKTPMEKIAAEKALIVTALEGMERMHPRPNPEIFEQHRQLLQEANRKLKDFAAKGEDVETAYRVALDAERSQQMETDALAQAWQKKNPGKRTFELGGPETQKLYEEVVAAPKQSDRRAQTHTYDYCRKSGIVALPLCARCKKVAYCTKECQKASWKAHKKICVPWTNAREPKSLYQTWDEVEAHEGAPVTGKTLEVRAMLDESLGRQVFSCKDRVGKVRRVAAYTNSRKFEELKQGSLIR